MKLSPDHELIRDSVRRLAEAELAPIAARIDAEDWFPARLLPAPGRDRRARRAGARGVRRQRRRLHRRHPDHGRAGARLRLGLALVRRARRSVRRSDRARLLAGAEGPRAAATVQRRGDRRLGAHRAELRLRRARHAHARGAPGRPLRARRRQDLHHQRLGSRDSGRLRAHRSVARAAGDLGVPGRRRRPRASAAVASSTRWACAAAPPPSCASTDARRGRRPDRRREPRRGHDDARARRRARHPGRDLGRARAGGARPLDRAGRASASSSAGRSPSSRWCRS